MKNTTWHCTIADCDRPKTGKAAKGMCGYHYNRTLPRAPSKPKRMRGCAVDGCLKVSRDRLCAMHARLRRLAAGLNEPCSVTACDGFARALGWCEGHYQRFTKYGLRPEEYDALLAAQGGVCAICRSTETQSGYPLVVDHDHDCCPDRRTCGKCVRGILCKSCNVGIGNLKDKADLALAAYQYLNGSVV